jgi:hypothetical protein
MSATPELDLLSSIEGGHAPRRILEFAARGFVPLSPGDLVRAIGSILALNDPELAELAEQTFKTFDELALRDAVASQNIRTEQLTVIALRTDNVGVLENIIRHRNVSDETLAWLAERVGPWLQDVLITNQVRLLRYPTIVERLFENPHLSTDIRRRADEFLEEFFLKRMREEEEQAARDQAMVDAAAAAHDFPLPDFDDADDAKIDPVAVAAAADAGTIEDVGGNMTKLAMLTVVQRIKIAYSGSREERLYLVRDNNRLVQMAVLRSPKTREADAEVIANMKTVSEDVLRTIAMRKQWTKRYQVLSGLVKNPRTPIDIGLTLMPRVLPKDMRLLAKERNIPEAIRNYARRAVARYES